MVGRIMTSRLFALGYAIPKFLFPSQESVLIAFLSVLILMVTPAHHQDSRWNVIRPYNAKLERMAMCESTKRWYLNTHNGYYGGLQFDLKTWKSVGGHGYPHQNSKLEQKYRAVKLIKKRGYKPWPKCGYA